MQLSDKVSSLYLSKRLAELGVKQESLFYWGETSSESGTTFQVYFNDSPAANIITEYAAFTASELSELLPSFRIITVKYKNKLCWRCKDLYRYYPVQIGLTEVEARAEMLIHLLENNLIETPK